MITVQVGCHYHDARYRSSHKLSKDIHAFLFEDTTRMRCITLTLQVRNEWDILANVVIIILRDLEFCLGQSNASAQLREYRIKETELWYECILWDVTEYCRLQREIRHMDSAYTLEKQPAS
jgi:hypothetical protein